MKRSVQVAVWLIAAVTPLAGQSSLDLVRARVAELMRQQPNYTCSRTIERSELQPGSKKWERIDRLRLEVALVNGKELFAWPGADHFEDRTLLEMVGGSVGNGDFAIFARTIFLKPEANLTFDGEEKKGGRTLIRMKFEVPQMQSGYSVNVNGEQAIVGYFGAAWASALTYDPVRLEITVSDIPPRLRMRGAQTIIDYVPMKIGATDTVLPSGSEIRMTMLRGIGTRLLTTFSDCRQYGAQSKLTFVEEAPQSAEGSPAPRFKLGAGLVLKTRLMSHITSANGAVGDPFTAELVDDLNINGVPAAAKGSTIEGRLTRLERRGSTGKSWWVGFRIERIRFGGSVTPLQASLEGPRVIGSKDPKLGGALYPGIMLVIDTKVDLKPGLVITWRTE